MSLINQPLNQKLKIIKDSNESGYQFFIDEPLISMRLNADSNDELLDRAFLSNIICFGEEVIQGLFGFVSSNERKNYLNILKESLGGTEVTPVPYSALKSMGVEVEGQDSAYQNIITKIKRSLLKERGITRGKKGISVNFNVFVRHLLKRLEIYVIGDNFIVYDYNSGKYVYVMDDFIKAKAKDILHEAAPDIWKMSYGKNVIEQLKLDARRLDIIEENRNYLNLKNGLLNLDNFNLIPHTPEVISFMQLPVNHDVNAKCPEFIKFINTIFDGDIERINLIQEIFGYCLTTDTKLQKFFIFYGRGSNGKSVLANIFRKVCGTENCSGAMLEQLSKQFGGQVINNKLLNISGESNSTQSSLNTQLLKLITGEDMIQVESKFKDPIMIRPFVKLLVLANHYPKTEDTSNGFLRRCLFIPFNKRFVDTDVEPNGNEAYKDKDLGSKLDAEVDGIFMWALKGYQRLKSQNYELTTSKECEKVLKDFMIYNNPIKEFIIDRLGIDEGNRELKSDIFAAFQEWCKKNNVCHYNHLSAKGFWAIFDSTILEFKNFNYKKLKSNGKYYICNVKLR